MSDLLASLLAAKSNSSQESFQSSYSQPSPGLRAAIASSASDMNPPASSKTQASAFQDAGLSVYDVDSYLAEAKNLASSTQASNEGSHSQHMSTQVASNRLEPISLGSKTRHHVAALNILCQAKGLTAVYEIEGGKDFGGVLKLGETTVKSEERWKSKKDAKEGLAEKGLDIVKAIDAKGKQSERSGEAGKNWVGMLLEYHNYIDPSRGPIYEEYVLGLFFACECTIPSRPNQLFGSKTEMFSNKKAARVNAAKQAVEYLISEGELNPDGSTKARKKIAAGAAVRMEGKGLKVAKDLSYAQKVNDICPLLGLSPPQYKLAPASALAPNMLSGYASFPGQPGVPEQIGEARNVYGKRNAKEEVAEGVWKFLLELAKKRDVIIEEVGGSGFD